MVFNKKAYFRFVTVLLIIVITPSLLFAKNQADSTSQSQDSYAISPLFKQILELYKKSLEAYIKGNYPDAVINAQNALLLDPLQEECYLLMKQSKAKMGILEKEGNPGTNALDSTEQKKLFERAMSLYLQKDYIGAKRRLELLLAINSNYPEIASWIDRAMKNIRIEDSISKVNTIAFKYFQTALSYYEKSDKVRALAYLDTTIHIYPGQTDALMLRSRIMLEVKTEYMRNLETGKSFFSTGDYYKAISSWKAGLQYASDKSSLLSLIDEAEKQVREIKTMYTSEVQSALNRNDQNAALRFLKKMHELTPDDAAIKKQMESLQAKKDELRNSMYESAMNAWKKGEFTNAFDLFTKVTQIDPEFAPAKEYASVAEEKMIMKKNEEQNAISRKKALEMEQSDNINDAVFFWNQILETSPNDKEAVDALKRLSKKAESKQRNVAVNMMYSRSIDLFKNGKYQEAREMWKQILDKDPQNVPINQMLSELESKKQMLIAKGDQYAAKNNYSLAVREYSDALRTDPDNNAIQQKLTNAEKKAAESEMQKSTANSVKPQVNSKEIDELFSRGLEFYMAQQFDKALENWNKIIAMDPSNQRVQSYITNLKNKMKKLDQL